MWFLFWWLDRDLSKLKRSTFLKGLSTLQFTNACCAEPCPVQLFESQSSDVIRLVCFDSVWWLCTTFFADWGKKLIGKIQMRTNPIKYSLIILVDLQSKNSYDDIKIAVSSVYNFVNGEMCQTPVKLSTKMISHFREIWNYNWLIV